MTMLDLFFVVIILIFAVKCALTGLVAELLKKLAVVLGVLCAFLFSPSVSSLLIDTVKNPFLAQLCAIILIFALVFVALHILMTILGVLLNSVKILASLDKTLGFFFGIIEGLVVVLLLLFILYGAELLGLTDICSKSLFFNLLFPKITPVIQGEILSQPLNPPTTAI